MLSYKDTNLCTEQPYQMTCNVCMANISTLKLGSEVAEVTQTEYQKLRANLATVLKVFTYF